MICYAIKDEEGRYWCGYNSWDKQMRKAKLYTSEKYIYDTIKRFAHKNLEVVNISMIEVTEEEAEQEERPTAYVDAEPVRHGRWTDKIGGYWDSVKCSVCGERFPSVGEKMNYCPNCGAKMNEVSE